LACAKNKKAEELMSEVLDKIYSARWQEGIFAKHKDEKWDKKKGSLVYGEMTRAGANNLITALSPRYLNKTSVFYDIGSGTGKIVLHINNVIGCKSIGIEMSKGRVEKAKEMQLLVSRGKVQFINKLFQECDISDATVVYADTTCFKPNMLEQLIDKISKGCMIVTSQRMAKKNYTPIEELYCPGINYGAKSWQRKPKETYNILLGTTYARNMRGYCFIKE
jgi:SAM-dependent methyltransferase